MKRLLLALAFVLLWSHGVLAQVAKNDSGTPSVGALGVTTVTLSTFTVSTGSDRCLLGLLAIQGTPTGVSMTWNGTSLTAGPSVSFGTTSYAAVFVLPNPTTGNHDLIAGWTGAAPAALMGIAFSGADQSTCIAGADNQTYAASDNTIDLTIPTTSTGATVAIARLNNGGNALSAGTEIAREFFFLAGAYTIGGTGSNHITWDPYGGNDDEAAVGVHVIAASASSPPANTHGLLILGGGK